MKKTRTMCAGLRLAFFAAWFAALFSISAYAQDCCKVCSKGKPCGNTYISRDKQCHKPPGCACAVSTFDHLWTATAFVAQSPTPLQIKFTDGDSIWLGNEEIRLDGIDAPEMKQTCTNTNGREWPCGRAALGALKKIATGNVTCRKTGYDSLYDRTVAICSANGVAINSTMVRQGWAFAFTKYSKIYIADERAARNAKIGIWVGAVQAPWDWRRDVLNKQIAAFGPKGSCVIKGNISKDRKIYYLPFHLLYARVKIDEMAGEKWFCNESDAMAAGWRRAIR